MTLASTLNRTLNTFIVLAGLLGILGQPDAVAQSTTPPLLLTGLEGAQLLTVSPAESQNIVSQRVVQRYATERASALEVVYNTSGGTLVFRETLGNGYGIRFDASYNAIAIDVANLTDMPLTFRLTLNIGQPDLASPVGEAASAPNYTPTGTTQLAPHESTTLVMPLMTPLYENWYTFPSPRMPSPCRKVVDVVNEPSYDVRELALSSVRLTLDRPTAQQAVVAIDNIRAINSPPAYTNQNGNWIYNPQSKCAGKLLWSFETEKDVKVYHADESGVSVWNSESALNSNVNYVTEGKHSLQVTFKQSSFSQAVLLTDTELLDLSAQNPNAFALDIIAPPGTFAPFFLYFGFYDDTEQAVIAYAYIKPGETTRALVITAPETRWMQGAPPVAGYQNLLLQPAYPDYKPNRFRKLTINCYNLTQDVTLYFDHVRSLNLGDLYSGIYDEFGQNSRVIWDDKLLSAKDFERRRDAERLTFKTGTGNSFPNFSPSYPNDQYGGYTDSLPPGFSLSQVNGTGGFFRTAKDNSGKWWLYTPSNKVFFSAGLDAVQPEIGPYLGIAEVTEGATTYRLNTTRFYSKLPFDKTPFELSDIYYKATNYFPPRPFSAPQVSFFKANTSRKYAIQDSAALYDKLREVAHRRMESWGFNSFGAASVFTPQREDQAQTQGYNLRLPYCPVVFPDYFGYAGSISLYQRINPRLPDPYDPQYAVVLTDLLTQLYQFNPSLPSDPYLIGYYIDNELDWGESNYDLAIKVLSMPDTYPDPVFNSPPAPSLAKANLVAFIQQVILGGSTSIIDLNARWRTAYEDWSSFDARVLLELANSTSPDYNLLRLDLARLTNEVARQYFETVRDIIKDFDPNHLYLGCRFNSSPPEVVKACAAFCDVMSFNLYKKTIKQRTATNDGWALHDEVEAISVAYNKPIIIGEFHFGSTDQGALSATVAREGIAKTQAERAQLYYNYVQDVARDKSFVGCQYYMYHDCPLTGEGWRTLGFQAETYGIGFISVTDDPYPLLIQKAKDINLNIYNRRFENTNPE